MDRRLELQTLLEGVGAAKVYYQPPPNVRLVYPCILYALNNVQTRHANNNLYTHKKRYTVTVIDKNPDSPIPDKVLELPLASFTTRLVNDGLYHTVHNLYY